MSEPVTIKLSSPITTHAGEVSSITLKEPKVRSFVRHGEPFKMKYIEGKFETEYSNQAMLNFIADMSGIDANLLEDISAGDYLELRANAQRIILGLTGVTERPTNPSEA